LLAKIRYSNIYSSIVLFQEACLEFPQADFTAGLVRLDLTRFLNLFTFKSRLISFTKQLSLIIIIRIRSHEAMQRLQLQFWQNAFFLEMPLMTKSLSDDVQPVMGTFLHTEAVYFKFYNFS